MRIATITVLTSKWKGMKLSSMHSNFWTLSLRSDLCTNLASELLMVVGAFFVTGESRPTRSNITLFASKRSSDWNLFSATSVYCRPVLKMGSVDYISHSIQLIRCMHLVCTER